MSPRDPARGADDELLASLVRDCFDLSLTASSAQVERIERENNLKYARCRSALGARSKLPFSGPQAGCSAIHCLFGCAASVLLFYG
jgi:hypothetical protein